MPRRPGLLTLFLFALVGACGAVLLPGAGATSTAGPVFRLSFSFTAVGKTRPPNIIETRRVGKGQLEFDTSPDENRWAVASAGSGDVALEYDVLTPHPRTERLELDVTGGNYDPTGAGYGAARIFVQVTAFSSTCRVGQKGEIDLEDAKTLQGVQVVLPGCGIREGQTAAPGRNSRVHVSLDSKCLAPRTTQAAVGKPLCGSRDPVVGTWTWKYAPPGEAIAAHGSVTFSSDGKMSWSGGASGTWKRAGNSLTLTWKKTETDIDTMTLSADGRTMSGSNNSGWSVQGVKH